MRTVVLDNEAVQALARVTHPKHRSVVAHLAGVASRRRRGRATEAVVPTSVRVEAGWNRVHAGAAVLNRLRVRDHLLDARTADVAADIVATGVVAGVADAHIGAAVRAVDAAGDIHDIVVLSSDPRDMAAVCSPATVTVVAI